MSLCVPCFHVDMEIACLHVSLCNWTWIVSMSPCLHVDMDN